MTDVVLLAGTDEDPAGLRAEAAALRTRVFVDGQGVDPLVEADDLDSSADTIHAIAVGDGAVLATGRVVDPGGDVAWGRVGRMAAEPAVRGRGYGSAVLRALERASRDRGLVGVELHAQVSAQGFYERAGYDAYGEIYLEQGMEHQSMRLSWLPGLRPVTDDDAAAVQDLIGGCFAEYDGCVLDLADLDAWMVHPASRPLWVLPAADPGVLDACVCVGGTELKSLYVRATARGRGLGASLVRLAERSGAVELWSDTRFLDAHRLYARLGWVRGDETRELNDPSHTTEYVFRRSAQH